MRIEWDDRKAEANLEVHEVSFEEGTTVLRDPLAATILDDFVGEERWVTIGQSATGKTLVVVFTDREETVGEDTEQVIRIISARLATPQEKKEYEEGI